MLFSSSARETTWTSSLLVLLVGLLIGAVAVPVHAQTGRSDGSFYGKIGVGASDYTGDFPAQNVAHPFDLQEFTRGSGVPVVVVGELGYQFSPKWALALGFQGGNYPIVGYSGGPSGIEDSYRYTPQLLGRYTFSGLLKSVAPYIDVGVNATFGGDSPPTSTGFGPSVGGGVDVPLSRALSFYVESRFNMTLPDGAVDGASAGGSFDLTNQLLGFGLKIDFTTPTPPRIIELDGPATAQAGTPVTFAGTINEGEVDRPLDYQWDFGDGETGSSLRATHTYSRPGTYTVAFSARNGAGNASKTMTVEVTPQPSASTSSKSVRVSSLTVRPNPVVMGEPVHFESTVEGGSVSTYEWALGDGSTASSTSPAHTYRNPGQYEVRLSVSGPAGSDTRTGTVQVVVPSEGTNTGESETDEKQRQSESEGERWVIVVASMRAESGAQAIAQRYRDRLDGAMSVDVVTANTNEGLRYRVVVGEFKDKKSARQAIAQHKENLPPMRWTLHLEQ